jgi:hypothetical protein
MSVAESSPVASRAMKAESNLRGTIATVYARAIAACEAVDIVGADECIAAIRELTKE